MNCPANVVKAIESFDSWSTPWTFFATASAFPSLGTDDRQLLEQAWTSACDRDMWISIDNLASGAAAVEDALSERFPWLSPLARRQLARAAAYEWR